MKKFLKKEEVSVKNGGYLFDKDERPISNSYFSGEQSHAEYVITLREKLKGKDLKGKEPVTLHEVQMEVIEELNKNKIINFIPIPENCERPLTDKLKQEALNFIECDTKKERAVKVNKFLQGFKTIKQFEDFGLFFEEEICTMNRIYTIKEIVEAVEEIIEYLN